MQHPIWYESTSAEPDLLISLERPSTGDCPDTDIPETDDVGIASSLWVSTQLFWTVQTTGTPACPELVLPNYRVVSTLPLPDDEFKVYVQDADSLAYQVGYWNGTELEDLVDIEVVWDGDSTGPDHACIENPSAFVYPAGPNTKEGMMMRLVDPDNDIVDDCDISLDVDPADLSDGNSSAIVFAKLING